MLWPIRMVLTSVLVGVVVLLSVPLQAQLIVNDPLNYAQNVLTAARSLQQINIALMGLANQLKMLQNQYQNLLKLPYSSLMSVEQSYRQTLALLGSAQKLTYNVEHINQTFSRLYPQSLGGTLPQQQIVNNARERWQTAGCPDEWFSARTRTSPKQAWEQRRRDTAVDLGRRRRPD